MIEGIEHLSSLPRGTGALGFYEKPAERLRIVAIRSGTEVPGLPVYHYLAPASRSFADYAEARANRRDEFFKTAQGLEGQNKPLAEEFYKRARAVEAQILAKSAITAG